MYKNVFNANPSIYLDYGYLMFPINLSIIPKIKIGTKTFFSKNGYHVSLIRLEDFSESDQKKVLSFAQKYPLKFKEITNLYRFVRHGNQQSIIVCIRLLGLKKLIFAVNKHFGYNFVYPPTHITLFTLKNQHGVAVNSTDEYQELTCQVDKKDSQKLAKSFRLIY